MGPIPWTACCRYNIVLTCMSCTAICIDLLGDPNCVKMSECSIVTEKLRRLQGNAGVHEQCIMSQEHKFEWPGVALSANHPNLDWGFDKLVKRLGRPITSPSKVCNSFTAAPHSTSQDKANSCSHWSNELRIVCLHACPWTECIIQRIHQYSASKSYRTMAPCLNAMVLTSL